MKVSEALILFYESMSGVLSPKTVRFYQDRLPSLVEFTNDAEIDSITIYMLRSWRTSLLNKDSLYENHPFKPTIKNKHLSPFTIHQYIRGAKRFFNWLRNKELIPKNPAERLELPALPDYKPKGIGSQDRDLIIDACKENPRDYAIILFLCDTACRVGGVSHLKMNDLSLITNRAVIWEKGRGGGNKSRTVFFTPETSFALANYLSLRPNLNKCEYVFVSCKNGVWGRFQEGGIYEMLERYALKAGVADNFNPHSFRHGAIKGMLQNNLSLPEVSQIAGHSSVAVTGDIYGKFDEDHLASRHAKSTWLSDRHTAEE
jgi:integrase